MSGRSENRDADSAALSAKPLEWTEGSTSWWSDSRMGFNIEYNLDEEPDCRFTAMWGEGDCEHFPTLDEAKAWCQDQADGWIRDCGQLVTPNTPVAAQPGSAVQVAAPAYGIIDPDYARVFTIARCIAWSEGYALAMQGSFSRDLDLLAVPWTDVACEPEHLARRIEDAAGLKITRPSKEGEKPHGRLVWTLKFKTFGDPRFIDLSVMPRFVAPACTPGSGA